jgi:hypothetical protein
MVLTDCRIDYPEDIDRLTPNYRPPVAYGLTETFT